MIPPETIARESPDEIGAAIAAEWGEGIERMDQADIAKIAAEGARRARGEHIREGAEGVKLETSQASMEAAVTLEIKSTLGLATTRSIGELIEKVATAREATARAEERAACRDIALAIDSGRGNEKEIAAAIMRRTQ